MLAAGAGLEQFKECPPPVRLGDRRGEPLDTSSVDSGTDRRSVRRAIGISGGIGARSRIMLAGSSMRPPDCRGRSTGEIDGGPVTEASGPVRALRGRWTPDAGRAESP